MSLEDIKAVDNAHGEAAASTPGKEHANSRTKDLDLEVKFGEILLRPVERTVASGAEGDGAGLYSVPT